MSGVISSVQNDFVRTARTLKDRKGRMEQGAFLVEGVKCVRELLEHMPLLLRTLIVTEDAEGEWAALAGALGRQAVVVAPHVMAAICDTKTPQGVAAVASLPEPPEIGQGFIVALDDVQDPANVGTIIRTADAAGCSGVLLSEGSADPYGPKAVRASMGSLFHLPVVRTAMQQYLVGLGEAGYKIVCASLDGKPDFSLDAEKTCLVIGNEARGISQEILSLSDVRVRIPIYGKAESLNAAVAAGILIYKIRS
jgi:TrmH family RNA methyltransferase